MISGPLRRHAAVEPACSIVLRRSLRRCAPGRSCGRNTAPYAACGRPRRSRHLPTDGPRRQVRAGARCAETSARGDDHVLRFDLAGGISTSCHTTENCVDAIHACRESPRAQAFASLATRGSARARRRRRPPSEHRPSTARSGKRSAHRPLRAIAAQSRLALVSHDFRVAARLRPLRKPGKAMPSRHSRYRCRVSESAVARCRRGRAAGRGPAGPHRPFDLRSQDPATLRCGSRLWAWLTDQDPQPRSARARAQAAPMMPPPAPTLHRTNFVRH